ncbi:MAG: prolipoprotein diacylglyceryl transferase [Armatimonadota bacterium]|nr:prolipoprotein diacylglyceryl transferase [bacterium]
MHSTLFTIFGLPIRSYGLMMVIGFSLGLWRAQRAAQRRGLNSDRVYDLALTVLLSGVLGARLVYILLNMRTESFREFFAVWNGGLSFHGGVLFAVVAAYLFTRKTKLSFWAYTDLLAPSVAIGYAFTRIGCFLNGCCYGAPTSLPWGVRFMENGTLTPPSHPTQIYAFLASLLIFFVLTRLEKLNRAPGFIFTSYLGLYGVYRFLIEFPRKGYSAQEWFMGLTQAQVVSIAMIVIAAIVILAVYRRPSKPIVGVRAA